MTVAPIVPRVVPEGEFGPKLMATDTSLGADDGIGVASMLAILDSTTAPHGPLECLFTIDEVCSLIFQLYDPGAISFLLGSWDGWCSSSYTRFYQGFSLQFMFKSLFTILCSPLSHPSQSPFLINLDSEESWRITVGCAGAFNVEQTLPVLVEQDLSAVAESEGLLLLSLPLTFVLPHPAIHFLLSDFQSGHSGNEIHLGRANPIQCLARILRRIESEGVVVRLAALSGGSKRNAIPADAQAVVLLLSDDVERALDAAEEEFTCSPLLSLCLSSLMLVRIPSLLQSSRRSTSRSSPP
jgi:dipeptidase D